MHAMQFVTSNTEYAHTHSEWAMKELMPSFMQAYAKSTFGKKRKGKCTMCFEKRLGCVLPEKIWWGLACFNGRGRVVAVVRAMIPSTVMSQVLAQCHVSVELFLFSTPRKKVNFNFCSVFCGLEFLCSAKCPVNSFKLKLIFVT